MSHLESTRTAEVEMMDSSKAGLYRLGGAAALILLLYCVATMIVLAVLGAAPSTAAETFAMLQNNRIIGLLRLDVLTVFIMPLYYLLLPSICVALWRTAGLDAVLATALVFVGLTLFLATPSALSMLALSDKYVAATTEAARGQLLAAGEAVVASDMWHGTGAIVGGLLLQCGTLWISVAMLKGTVFSKAVAWSGILTHGLDLAHLIILPFVPPVGIILLSIGGVLYLVWLPLVGFRLFQLARA